METIIELNDKKMQLKECIAQIEKTGKALIISRGKKPVAKLIPHKNKDPLSFIPSTVNRKPFLTFDP